MGSVLAGAPKGHMRRSSTSPKKVNRIGEAARLGNFLTDRRIQLLEQIDRHGSISQAAKAVPMSYKAAWDAIDAMNNLAPRPLVERTTGGLHGGGSSLTDYGRRLIDCHCALEREYQGAIDRLSAQFGEADAADVGEFRQLLQRISMKASARNQFAGPVVALKEGPVDCEVSLRVDADVVLTAIVTKESVENLGIAKGVEMLAFVKSSSILLLEDTRTRISARNRISGTISRIDDGPVNAEVSLEFANGRRVLTSVITHDSLKAMGLKVGSRAMAAFKASSVFLVASD